MSTTNYLFQALPPVITKTATINMVLMGTESTFYKFAGGLFDTETVMPTESYTYEAISMQTMIPAGSGLNLLR